MDFEELIAALQNPGEGGLPDTIYDDLRTAHTTALDGAGTRLAEAEAARDAALAEVERVKAKNWDLYQQVQANGNEGNEDDADDSEVIEGGIEELFESDEVPTQNY